MKEFSTIDNLPSISVVIPYFNDSLVFQRTLDSIYSQKLQPNEIIIVDDCSDDSDVLDAILEKNIGKTNIKIIKFRNSLNKNGAFSRNLGIKNSSYDLIALLDADDYWEEDHLYVSVVNLNSKNLDFIFSNVVYIDGNKKYVRKVLNPDELENKNDIILMSPPQTNSFIFDRKVFMEKKIYFDEKLRRHQDYQFLLLCLNSDIKYDYLNINTACYCVPSRNNGNLIDYNSMLYFWSENYNFFTRRMLQSFVYGICIDFYFFKGKQNFLKGIDNKIFKDYVLNDFLIKIMLILKIRNKFFHYIFKFFHYLKNDRRYFIDKFKLRMSK